VRFLKLFCVAGLVLLISWLHCSGRSGQLQMLSFRVAMVLMCNADIEEKYSSLFTYLFKFFNEMVLMSF